METNGNIEFRTNPRQPSKKLTVLKGDAQGCDFTGYNADMLMKETAKLRKLITSLRNLGNSDTIMLYYKSCKVYKI